MSKMYIAIKNTTPVGHAMNCAAHAALLCYVEHQNYNEMKTWLKESFRKVTCKVNEETFEQLKRIPNHVVISESALNDQEIAIAFCPREEWPEVIRNMKLWR